MSLVAVQRVASCRSLLRPARTPVKLTQRASVRLLSGGAPVKVEYIDRPPEGSSGGWERKIVWTTAAFTVGCIGVGYVVAKYVVKEAKQVQSEFVSIPSRVFIICRQFSLQRVR